MTHAECSSSKSLSTFLCYHDSGQIVNFQLFTKTEIGEQYNQWTYKVEYFKKKNALIDYVTKNVLSTDKSNYKLKYV